MTHAMTSAGSVDAQTKFQQILLEAMSQAKVRNPAYSLRAFARRLEISPAALSEIMAGKRRVSANLARRILERINTNPSDLEVVFSSLSLEKSSSAALTGKDQIKQVTILSNDRFKIVSEWYHFGILSLMETANFDGSVANISSRLNVPRRDITAAIKRLERLGMLQRSEAGVLELTGQEFHSSDGVPSSAIRASHASSLDMAKTSLEVDPVSIRDITTVTIAINPDELETARKIIRKFRADIAKALGKGEKSEVYMINVNVFPLSKNQSV